MEKFSYCFQSNLDEVEGIRSFELMFIRSILFALSIFFSLNNYCQTAQEDLGAWYMYVGRNQIADKWSVQTDAHLRLYSVAKHFEQTLLSAAANYHLDGGERATIGYAFLTAQSYSDSPFITVTEHRGFQAFFMTNTVGRFNFIHRYMLEQRWLSSNTGIETYKNRARYMLGINIPLNKAKIEKGAFMISITNDLLMHLEKNPFDQNRLFMGTAYQASKALQIQGGYYLQNFRTVDLRRIYVAVFFNPDLRKSE